MTAESLLQASLGERYTPSDYLDGKIQAIIDAYQDSLVNGERAFFRVLDWKRKLIVMRSGIDHKLHIQEELACAKPEVSRNLKAERARMYSLEVAAHVAEIALQPP